MITSRIWNARQWADRYRTAAGVTGGTARGRAAHAGELQALFDELVGSIAGVVMLPEDIERPELLHVVGAVRMAVGGEQVADPAPTVPLRELVDLARLVLEMRRAQVKFFTLRREQPHGDHTASLRYAQQVEVRCEAMARGALQRERPCLPGMGGD